MDAFIQANGYLTSGAAIVVLKLLRAFMMYSLCMLLTDLNMDVTLH